MTTHPPPGPENSAVAQSEQRQAGGPARLRRGDRVTLLTRGLLRLVPYIACTCHVRDRAHMRDYHAVDCPMLLGLRLTALAIAEGVEPSASPRGLHYSLTRIGL